MLVPLKLTPSAPSQVLVDRNLCWSQLPTGHLWYFRVGVPHRGGWLKEQAFIRSKSNIFPLHRSLSTVHVRINQENRPPIWTSQTFLAVASGGFLHRMWRGSVRLGRSVRGCDCRKEIKRFKKRSVGEMQRWRKWQKGWPDMGGWL